MTLNYSRSIPTMGRVPISAMLAPFPMVCFVGAAATDLAYWYSAAVMWETFSVWLLAAGLVMAGLAVFVGLLEFLFSRRIRAMRPPWSRLLGGTIVLVLSLVNVFVHSRDGYTAVVPQGLILSGLGVFILLVLGLTQTVPSYAVREANR